MHLQMAREPSVTSARVQPNSTLDMYPHIPVQEEAQPQLPTCAVCGVAELFSKSQRQNHDRLAFRDINSRLSMQRPTTIDKKTQKNCDMGLATFDGSYSWIDYKSNFGGNS